jgi:6-phosphogluconolactonase
VFVYRIDPETKALTRDDPPYLQMPAGTGPRHLRFSRDGRLAFLDTELSGEIYTLRWDAKSGRLTPLSHVALDPASYTGERSAAEIDLSSDGRFLYASNRGENLLHVFAIDPSSGSLTEIQKLPCGGDFPWSFGIDPDGRWLVVANETSSNLAVFAIDRVTGKLAATGNQLSVPKPVAIAFSRP